MPAQGRVVPARLLHIKTNSKNLGDDLRMKGVTGMTERLNQFRQRLTYTKQSLVQPVTKGGCRGASKPTLMSTRDQAVDSDSGCVAKKGSTSSTK